jgi:hypothetical protein
MEKKIGLCWRAKSRKNEGEKRDKKTSENVLLTEFSAFRQPFHHFCVMNIKKKTHQLQWKFLRSNNIKTYGHLPLSLTRGLSKEGLDLQILKHTL